jgi:hypothetical protein
MAEEWIRAFLRGSLYSEGVRPLAGVGVALDREIHRRGALFHSSGVASGLEQRAAAVVWNNSPRLCIGSRWIGTTVGQCTLEPWPMHTRMSVMRRTRPHVARGWVARRALRATRLGYAFRALCCAQAWVAANAASANAWLGCGISVGRSAAGQRSVWPIRAAIQPYVQPYRGPYRTAYRSPMAHPIPRLANTPTRWGLS